MESLNLQSPMNALCRTCLKANKKFTNIFSHVNNQRTVKEMLVDCTAIEVETNDDLPKSICSECLKILTLAFNFKAMATDCNTKLCNIHQAFLQDPDDVKVRPLEMKMFFTYDDIEITPTVVVPDKPSTNEGDYVNNVVADSCVTGTVNKEADENIVVKKEDTVNLLVLTDHSESENTLDININEKSTDFISDPRDQLNNSPNCESTEPELTSSPINVEKDIDDFRYDNEEIEKETPSSELDKHKTEINFKSRERYRQKIICEYCNQLFQFRYFVDVHIHTHTGNAPHKCDKCDKKFPKRSILNKHKQLHADTKSHQCNICGKMFISSSNLWRHRRIHTEQKRYKCDICNKVFKIREILTQHKMTHNMEKSICEICGKTFTSSSGLYLHMFTHNANENLKCPECYKVFANKLYLQRHVKRHFVEKSHACDKCDKSFSDKALLHHHSLIHTGEKPFSCEICGKTFRQKNCITRHMRTHTGETPYSCEQCPSQFKYSHHLVNHMKTHK